MDRTDAFEAERPRLIGVAARILGDRPEAEDVVQRAWLRLRRTGTDIDDLPAWLTTTTVRLCLDRLRSRTPIPAAEVEVDEVAPGPADEVELADTVGAALQVVLDRLTPRERVAFVLHDSLGFEFATVATLLDATPEAARKLASRARSKVRAPASRESTADWEVVDAFLAAARGGDLARLLRLLAPDVVVVGDAAAVAVGTPARIEGAEAVAGFFDGAAKVARPVFVADRPGYAWFQGGRARVVFDFTVGDGVVRRIDFRADPDVLGTVAGRDGADHRPVDTAARSRSASPDRHAGQGPSEAHDTDREGRPT